MAYTTINKPNEYFNTVLYTGDGSGSARTITGVGFQPDWLWNKSRSNAYNHYIFDVLRGTNVINSNTTTAEADRSPQFSAFTSDGFTITNDAGSLAINASGVTFANWCWKANGAGVSNTDGSITSTVSANTTSGFSIVSYTGTGANATIGHGLGSAPKMVIVKNLSTTSEWIVYNKNLTSYSYRLVLNNTDAQSNTSGSEYWTADPTSSVFSIGTNFRVNGSSNNLIAYCFAEKKGFSKFGSYTGNGSTDGTFIYTGFKPAFVIHKRTDSSGYSWLIHDNKRPDYNSTDKILEADLNAAEKSNYHMDLLSNGFKHRITSGSTNASGGTYIYMAFAENPLVGTNNIPATAR